MQCFRCSRPAIIYQRYSGRSLCSEHLCADIESRAKRSIRKNRWIVRGDRIGVLSGMAHSRALTIFLENLFSRRSDISLVSIDPPHTDDEKSLRWYQEISQHSIENGISRLALPYCAEDLAVEILRDILRGEAASLLSSGYPGMGIPVMQPLQDIPGEELEFYVKYRMEGWEEGYLSRSDPDHIDPVEHSIRNLLTEFSSRHPSAPHALRRYRENLRDFIRTD